MTAPRADAAKRLEDLWAGRISSLRYLHSKSGANEPVLSLSVNPRFSYEETIRLVRGQTIESTGEMLYKLDRVKGGQSLDTSLLAEIVRWLPPSAIAWPFENDEDVVGDGKGGLEDPEAGLSKLSDYYGKWGALAPPQLLQRSWNVLVVDDPSSVFWKCAYANLAYRGGYRSSFSVAVHCVFDSWRAQFTHYVHHEATTFSVDIVESLREASIAVRTGQKDPRAPSLQLLYDVSEGSLSLADKDSLQSNARLLEYLEKNRAFEIRYRLKEGDPSKSWFLSLDESNGRIVVGSSGPEDSPRVAIKFTGPREGYDAALKELGRNTTREKIGAAAVSLHGLVDTRPAMRVRGLSGKERVFSKLVVFVQLASRFRVPSDASAPTQLKAFQEAMIRLLTLRRVYALVDIVVNTTRAIPLTGIVEQNLNRFPRIPYASLTRYLHIKFQIDPTNNRLESVNVNDGGCGATEACLQGKAALEVHWYNSLERNVQVFNVVDPSVRNWKPSLLDFPPRVVSTGSGANPASRGPHINTTLPDPFLPARRSDAAEDDEPAADDVELSDLIREDGEKNERGRCVIGFYVGDMEYLLNHGRWDSRRCIAQSVDPFFLLGESWSLEYVIALFYVRDRLRARIPFRILSRADKLTVQLVPLPHQETVGPEIDYSTRIEQTAREGVDDIPVPASLNIEKRRK